MIRSQAAVIREVPISSETAPSSIILRRSSSSRVHRHRYASAPQQSRCRQQQASSQGSPKTSLCVLTNAAGQAQAYFQVSTIVGITSAIKVIPTKTKPTAPLEFHAISDASAPGNPTPPDPGPTPSPSPTPIPTPTADVPVQYYGCIDLSGSVQGNNNVTDVAVDDQGKAAVGWYVGQDANGLSAQYQVANWVNGAATTADALILDRTESITGSDGSAASAQFHYYPGCLLPNGNVLGAAGVLIPSNFQQGNCFFATGNSVTRYALPAPYVQSSAGPYPTGAFSQITAVASNGDFAGYGSFDEQATYGGSASGGWEVGFIARNNNADVFDTKAPTGFPSGGTTHVYTQEYFDPIALNVQGWALGYGILPYLNIPPDDYGTSLGGQVWNGQSFRSLGMDTPIALNDQNQVIVQGQYQATGPREEGYLWEQGASTVLVQQVPADLTGQIEDIQPSAISNQTMPGTDATIYILASATVDDVPYTTIVCTRDNVGTWSFAQVQSPDGVTISQYASINANGVIGGIGTISSDSDSSGTSHTSDGQSPPLARGIILLPVQLTNKADPTIRNGANGNNMPIQFLQSSTDTNIGAVAWIAGNDPNNSNAPRMPQLQAQVGGANGLAGANVYWKLQVIFHDRHGNPHRDFDTGDPNGSSGSSTITPDSVFFPSPGSNAPNTENGWHKITDGTPWNIYNDPDWQAEVANGFFGGDAVLSLEILDGSSNTIMPEQDYKFRIAGENPVPQLCQNYIASIYGGPKPPTRNQGNPNAWQGFWFADAIAQEETAGEGQSGTVAGSPVGNNHLYHQFLFDGGRTSAVPGKEGTPDWHNDKTNTHRTTGSGGYGLFQLTYQLGDTYYIMPRNWIWNWQANASAFGQEMQQHLTDGQNLYTGLTGSYARSGTIPNYRNLSGMEAMVITYYNGMWGGQLTKVTIAGVPTRSCWEPLSNGWQFLQNKNSYCKEVNSYVGNTPK